MRQTSARRINNSGAQVCVSHSLVSLFCSSLPLSSASLISLSWRDSFDSTCESSSRQYLCWLAWGAGVTILSQNMYDGCRWCMYVEHILQYYTWVYTYYTHRAHCRMNNVLLRTVRCCGSCKMDMQCRERQWQGCGFLTSISEDFTSFCFCKHKDNITVHT